MSVKTVEVKGEDVYSLATVFNEIGFEEVFIVGDVGAEVLDRYCQTIFNPLVADYVKQGLKIICSNMLGDWLGVNKQVKAIEDGIEAELFNPVEKLAQLRKIIRKKARICGLIERSKVDIGFFINGKVLATVLSVSTFKDPYTVATFIGDKDHVRKAKEHFTLKLNEFREKHKRIELLWVGEKSSSGKISRELLRPFSRRW